MKKKIQWLCLLTCLVMLTSCSPKNAEVKPPTTDPVPVNLFNPATLRPGILKVVVPLTNGHFNPLYGNDTAALWALDLVYEGLIDINSEGEYVPVLVDAFEKDASGFKYRFALKEGVLFHDQSMLTPEDVINSYEWMAFVHGDGDMKPFFDALVSIQSPEVGVVEFTFNTTNTHLMSGFRRPIFKESSELLNPVHMPSGTGPFFLREAKSDEWTFYRFDQHHEKQLTIESLVFKSVGYERAMALLESGSFDVGYIRPNLETEQRLEQTFYLKPYENASNLLSVIGFNLDEPKLQDKKIRHALAYGLDRAAFVSKQWPKGSEVAIAPIGHMHWAFPEDQALDYYTYDIGKANRLLDDAGWLMNEDKKLREKDGKPFELNLFAFADVDWAYNLAIQAKSDWEQMGLLVNLEITDFDLMVRRVFEAEEADAWVMAWHTTADMDPSLILGGTHPNMAAVLSALERAETLEARSALMSEWVGIANEELPMLNIAFRGEFWAVNTRVKGFEHSAFVPWTRVIDRIVLESGR